MARGTFEDDTQFWGAFAPVTAVPITFACWCHTTDNTPDTYRTLIEVGSGGANNRFVMSLEITSGHVIAVVVNNAGTVDVSEHNTQPANGIWFHAAAVFSNNTSRVAYLNGAAATEQTDSNTPSAAAIDSIGIGAHPDRASDPARTEWLAEVAIWNTALTAAEIGILVSGFSPLFVQPANLQVYLPLVRDLVDLKGNPFQTDGTPAVQPHPRIIMPQKG